MLGVALMSCCMASCGDSPEPVKDVVTASWPKSFNYVKTDGGNDQVFDAPVYKVEFENNSKTATVVMSNIRFSQGQTPGTYQLSGLNWQYDGSAPVPTRVIKVKSPHCDTATPYTFSDLEIVWRETTDIDGGKYEGFSMEYTVDNNMHVTVLPYETMYTGSTETVNVTAGSTFTSTSTIYTVTLRPATFTADIVVSKAAFAANMPALGDMLFPGVTLKLENGGFKMSCESLIPSIGGTPYPRFQITNLSGDCDLSDDMELVFDCQKVFTVTADLDMPLVKVAE